jgi:aspartate/methionine/tyrosine aminotransferase
MKLEPFALEQWLELHPEVKYNLALSTGPTWKLQELLDLMTDEEKQTLLQGKVAYCPSRGNASLRHAIAEWYGVDQDEVQIVTGASEALLSLFFHAAEPGANVVVPSPGFPPFTAVPESLGIETRTYTLRAENEFVLDTDAVLSLVDKHTKLLLVNTPHNPSGAVVPQEILRKLHDILADRGVQLVVDEVYRPIYHGEAYPTAASLPHSIVLGDLSKAFCLSGLRIGWIIDRDKARLEEHWNARSYFTISNTYVGEALAETAVRNREAIFARAREVAEVNLRHLEAFFSEHRDHLEWVRPTGSFTAFPRLVARDDSRPFCERAAERGVLLAPGDCFGFPQHFRMGFGACDEGFDEALTILGGVLKEI